jgi:DNA-binding CsgD family transcriptional regulator
MNLTPRESECLLWISRGKTKRETAIILGISHNTVQEHLERVRLKLDCVTLAQAVGKSVKLGLLQI